MMKSIAVASIVASASAFISNGGARSVHGTTFSQLKMSDNSNMFGGEKPAVIEHF